MNQHEFVIKVGISIKDLQIEDLQKMIVICGPKTDLRIAADEEQFMDKILSSKVYRENFVLEYTELTETDISKLYRACVKDEQGSLVGYMLRNNPTLYNLRLQDKNGKGYDAFEFVKFHKDSSYLSKIWKAFAAQNIEHDSIESAI